MSLWKNLAKPESFAGENEAAQAALPSGRMAPSGSSSPRTDKQQSVIGAGIAIDGNVGGNGDVRIAGSINGDVQLKGNLIVDAGAQILGAVVADSVALGGAVEGNLTAADHFTLLETGQLVGDVQAKYLTVAAGARLRGKVDCGWEGPETKPVESKTPNAKTVLKPVA